MARRSFLALLPRDVLAAVVRRCNFYRTREPARLVDSAHPLRDLVGAATRGVQFCERGCYYEGRDTLTLDSFCSAEDANKVLQHVGGAVERLVLYSAAPHFPARYAPALRLHCRSVRKVMLRWVRDGPSLAAASAFIDFTAAMLSAVGGAVRTVVLVDVRGIELEILDFVAEHCKELVELELPGEAAVKINGFESFPRWSDVASKLQVVRLNDFSPFLSSGGLCPPVVGLLRTLRFHCPHLKEVHLHACAFPISFAVLLKELYIQHADTLRHATMLNSPVDTCQEVGRLCTNLTSCKLLEDDPACARILSLGRRITDLTLWSNHSLDINKLHLALKSCTALAQLTVRTFYTNPIIKEIIFARSLTSLNVLSLCTFPEFIAGVDISKIAQTTNNLREITLEQVDLSGLRAFKKLAARNMRLHKVRLTAVLNAGEQPLENVALAACSGVDDALRCCSKLDELNLRGERHLSIVVREYNDQFRLALRRSLGRDVHVYVNEHKL